MTKEEINQGSLVIVLETERKPPRTCWGIVLKKLPSGNCDVQIGENRKDRIFVFPDQLIFVAHTKKKFKNPTEAVMAHLDEILLENTLISRTSRDFELLRRYKKLAERKLRSRFRRGLARLLKRVY